MAPLKNGMSLREYDLHQNSNLQWVQLIDSIPEKWKIIIKKTMKLQLILSLVIISYSKAQEL